MQRVVLKKKPEQLKTPMAGLSLFGKEKETSRCPILRKETPSKLGSHLEFIVSATKSLDQLYQNKSEQYSSTYKLGQIFNALFSSESYSIAQQAYKIIDQKLDKLLSLSDNTSNNKKSVQKLIDFLILLDSTSSNHIFKEFMIINKAPKKIYKAYSTILIKSPSKENLIVSCLYYSLLSNACNHKIGISTISKIRMGNQEQEILSPSNVISKGYFKKIMLRLSNDLDTLLKQDFETLINRWYQSALGGMLDFLLALLNNKYYALRIVEGEYYFMSIVPLLTFFEDVISDINERNNGIEMEMEIEEEN